MALGVAVDAGADLDEVRALLERLPVRGLGARGRAGAALRHRRHQGPRARRGDHRRAHRRRTSPALVEEARLPDRVRRPGAGRVRAPWPRPRAGCTAARPSRCTSTRSAALDAIVDVVGTCAALEVLGIDDVYALGGRHRHRHGPRRPRPAPQPGAGGRRAARRGGAPDLRARPRRRAHHAHRRRPARRAGLGLRAAAADDDRAQRLRRRHPRARRPAQRHPGGDRRRRATRCSAGQPVVLLEVNVDDATGETLAHAVAALLDAGAHDAWVTPIVMKKGRPAHTVSRAGRRRARRPGRRGARPPRPARSACGARRSSAGRRPAQPTTVEVAGYPVRVKVSPGRVKVEHDDAARVARRAGLPLREVLSLAEEAGRRTLRIVPEPVPDRRVAHEHPPPVRPRPRRPRLNRRDPAARGTMDDAVPVETCEACRFDGAQYDLPDTLGTLRALGPMWQQTVEGVDRRRARRPARRPACGRPPSTCSHSADVVADMGRLLARHPHGRRPRARRACPSRADPRARAGSPPALDRLAANAAAPARQGGRRSTAPTTRAWQRTRARRRRGRSTPPGSSATPSTTPPTTSCDVGPRHPPARRRRADPGGRRRPAQRVRRRRAQEAGRGRRGRRPRAGRRPPGRPPAPRPAAAGAVPLVGRGDRRAPGRGPPDRAGPAGENVTLSRHRLVDASGPARSCSSATCSPRSPRGPRRARRTPQWFADRDFNRMDHDRHPGWSRAYAWVREPGTIRQGDPVVVEP